MHNYLIIFCFTLFTPLFLSPELQLSVGVICFHGAVELSVDVSRSLGNGQSAVYGVIFAIPAVAYPFFDLCRKEIREKGLSYNSGLFESARKGPAIRDRADKPGGVAIVEVFSELSSSPFS